MSDRYTALHQFLLATYIQPELDFLVRRLPREVQHSLPQGTSLNHYAHELIGVLQRRGLVDLEFFQLLARERPRHADALNRIAALWDVSLRPEVTPDPIRTPDVPPPTSQATPINDIFPSMGVPDINFVPPAQLSKIATRLKFMGEGLVVEGASGVGKTTAVRHALAQVLAVQHDQVPAHASVTWLTAKRTEDVERLDQLIASGDRALSGYIVLDDFHKLTPTTKAAVADAIKVIADDNRRDVKLVLIGINPIGSSLVREFRDVGGRFFVVGMNRQPNATIDALVRKGEEAANITFTHRARIVERARGSFFSAQMLCREICISEGIVERVPLEQVLSTSPDAVVDEVSDQLRWNYYDRLLSFASFGRTTPARGATLVLLWLLKERDELSVPLSIAKARFPSLAEEFDHLLESNLSGFLAEHEELQDLLFYNRDAGVLSAEDPRLEFYLDHLAWPAFARDSGHLSVQWTSGGIPEFDSPPAPAAVSTPPPSTLPRSHVLHLSDLHITSSRQAIQLFDQLHEDLRSQGIRSLNAVVISGDIVNRGSAEEYEAASHFFSEIRQHLELPAKRIVLVPGNHDLDWQVSMRAYRVERRASWTGPSESQSHVERGDYIEVAAQHDLAKRFGDFAEFYYGVRSEPYPLDPDHQATLHHIPEAGLLFLGLNSAWAIDHHHPGRASINAVAIGRALNRIDREPDFRDTLRIAVWHHPVHSATEDRIRDTGFLERLAQSGFRLALHGHVHKAVPGQFRYDVTASGRRLDLLGAGTFGAPTQAWVPGFPAQYQLLEFEENRLTVHTRRREEPDGAWKPDARWTQGAGEDPKPRYVIEL